jgi:hypothetical protein
MGLAVGAIVGGDLSEKLGFAGLGFVGFFLVAGIVTAFGACAGAAIGHAIYRFGIWRMLRLGGKVGGVFGVLVATPFAVSLGSGSGGAIGITWGEALAGNAGALLCGLLAFIVTMDTILTIGFGVGAAIGNLVHLLFDPNPSESAA